MAKNVIYIEYKLKEEFFVHINFPFPLNLFKGLKEYLENYHKNMFTPKDAQPESIKIVFHKELSLLYPFFRQK